MSSYPVPDLGGCALKLGRAESQFADLDRRVEAFINEVQPYRTQIELDTDGVHALYRLTQDVIQPRSDEWGPIVGEIAYNLASALDHLVCQLLIANGGGPDCAHTQFPIFEEDTYYARGQIAKYTRGLLPDDRRLITDLQPFKRGNDAHLDSLLLLRRINVIDKHRRLHLMTMGIFEGQVVMWRENPVEVADMTVTEATKAGAEVVRWDRTREIDKPSQTHLALIVQVSFDDPGGPLHGRSIRSLFPEISRYLREDVFPKFEHRVGKLPTIS